MTDRRIYHPDDADRFFKKRAGKSYRPSNGTEGEIFESAYCSQCKRDDEYQRWLASDGAEGADTPCAILTNVICCLIGDPEYPKEWIYGDDGQPTCTAFDPIKPDPDPNQLDMFATADTGEA